MTRILVTGGAGFIGSNLANRLLKEGHEITIFDNLSRYGCEANINWLRKEHGPGAFELAVGDLTDFEALRKATQDIQRIYHLAGQVAVTTSVKNPRQDFEANALGTFNILEAARLVGDNPILIYASTNKVYGELIGEEVIEQPSRYWYAEIADGVSETQALDFHSPYGCSKGAGDQYVRDYARIYGLRTVVFRQSCIYGYRQFGIEDQGWLAWFMIAALKGKSITIFGDGKQVRDALFIDDLLDAYQAAVVNVEVAAGQVYNIGGGPENSISIWKEFQPILEQLLGRGVSVNYADWRPGDQQIYVSDIRKAQEELGWQPRISIHDGLSRLFAWIHDNQSLFAHI